MRSRFVHIAVPLLAALALIPVMLGATPALAQGTPSPVATAAESHPAHIHNGTCADLGDVAVPLSDVTLAPAADGATPAAQPMMMHADEVLTSVTTVDITLPNLLAGRFAINIHESVENIGNYIACGDIAGEVRMHLRSDAPPGLVIPLRELNNSGYAGMAWLEPTSDGKTMVTIFLASGMVGKGPNP